MKLSCFGYFRKPKFSSFFFNFQEPKIQSFEGFCREENGRSKDLIGDFPTANIGSCYQKCKDTEGCVAFAFTPENTDNCDLYRGGPYTRGSGRAGSQCFPLEPGTFYALLKPTYHYLVLEKLSK